MGNQLSREKDKIPEGKEIEYELRWKLDDIDLKNLSNPGGWYALKLSHQGHNISSLPQEIKAVMKEIGVNFRAHQFEDLWQIVDTILEDLEHAALQLTRKLSWAKTYRKRKLSKLARLAENDIGGDLENMIFNFDNVTPVIEVTADHLSGHSSYPHSITNIVHHHINCRAFGHPKSILLAQRPDVSKIGYQKLNGRW